MILAGFVLSLFFFVLLLAKKPKSCADRVLFCWMLLIALHLLLFYIESEGLYSKFPHLIGVDMAFPIFHALFLYLYVRMLTSAEHRFYTTDMLHMLPALAAYLYMIPFFMKDGQEKLLYFSNIRSYEKVFLSVFTLYTIIAGIGYIFQTFRMIEKYKIYVGEHYSYAERINLRWMKRLLIGMSVVWLVFLFMKIVQAYWVYDMQETSNYFIFICASLFVCFLGYFGIRQTTIFSDNSITIHIENPSIKIKERYLKSGLKEEQVLPIKEKLLRIMETEKRYLDNKLTLDALAKEIDINPNYLSQVINEQFSKNFYDFVNQYRIEDFKQKVNSGKYKHYSILALALDCGFNSKSAFYTVFKKYTGITPSEFLKQKG